MKTKYSRLLAVVILMFMMISAFIAKPVQAASFQIISPDEVSYGDWGGKWWQWAISIPAANNPLLDLTGANCGVGQSGSVWFLAGSFATTTTANGDIKAYADRKCTISAGQSIFFPILNQADFEYLNPGAGLTNDDMLNMVLPYTNTATGLGAKIDGVAVGNLNSQNSIYRAHSGLFNLYLPPQNIFGAHPGDMEGVTDGWWLMLAPLTPGKHTIQFNGTLSLDPTDPKSPKFVLDVSYILTIQK